MSVLAPIAPKLALLIPRLGCENDSEVVAAVRAIGRQLQGAGNDWHDLAAAVSQARAASEEEPRQTRQTTEPSSPSEAVLWLMRRLHLLKEREARFIRDISVHAWRGDGMRLSPKQLKWLGAITQRVWVIETGGAYDDW